jgi:AbrB family looped-hinge helix DNA binding protein
MIKNSKYDYMNLVLLYCERRIIMAVVTTSSRGQIVIPKEIRERLEIVPGRKLLIKVIQ